MFQSSDECAYGERIKMEFLKIFMGYKKARHKCQLFLIPYSHNAHKQHICGRKTKSMALDVAECQLLSSLLTSCILKDMGSKMILNSILKLNKFPTGCKITWLLQIINRVGSSYEMTPLFFVMKPLAIAGFSRKLS